MNGPLPPNFRERYSSALEPSAEPIPPRTGPPVVAARTTSAPPPNLERRDAALGAFATNASAPSNDRILYVGANSPSVKSEVAALSGVARVEAAVVRPSSPNEIEVAGTRYSLLVGGPRGLDGFVDTLGLPPERRDAVRNVLARSQSEAKNVLASIARAWSGAERGEPTASRLVLSGHSSGTSIWGDAKGSALEFVDVIALGKALPIAAARVEDLHFSACSSARAAILPAVREQWRSAFPNLLTISGYAGASPLAPSGHLLDWARATRGGVADVAFSRSVAEKVVMWSRDGGLIDMSEPFEVVLARRDRADSRFSAYADGTRRPRSSSDAELVEDYRAYKSLAGHAETPAAARHDYELRAATLLRIRYYEEGVRTSFVARHANTIRRGYEAVELTVPSFETLGRKEALAVIATFVDRATSTSPLPAGASALLPILRAFAALDPSVVPDHWCRH